MFVSLTIISLYNLGGIEYALPVLSDRTKRIGKCLISETLSDNIFFNELLNLENFISF